MPEMDAPRALVFRPLVKGNEALGTRLELTLNDRAEKRLRMRHWRPSRPISFEIAQSARHLARKYRLEQHILNERPSSLLTSQ